MNKVSFIAKSAIIVALYTLSTIFIPSITFGPLQLRTAEVLMFLVLFDDKYIFSLVLSVGISNLFSPLGIVDVIFGTFATTLVLVLCILFKDKNKRLFALIILNCLINAFVIGLEYYVVMKYAFIVSFIEVIGSEFVVMLIGFFIYKIIIKNPKLVGLLTI